ncbi:MAG: hypothetical protein ABWX70_13460 [Hyphomicrobium sp.]
MADTDALASQAMAELDTFDLPSVNAGFSQFAFFDSTKETIYDEMFNLKAKGLFSRSRSSRR